MPAQTFTVESHLDIGTATEVEPPVAAGQGAQIPVDVLAARDTVYLRLLLRPRKWSSIKSSLRACAAEITTATQRDRVAEPDHCLRRYRPLDRGQSSGGPRHIFSSMVADFDNGCDA